MATNRKKKTNTAGSTKKPSGSKPASVQQKTDTKKSAAGGKRSDARIADTNSHPARTAATVELAENVFLHPASVVEGLVHIGRCSSVWGGAVIRADMNTIRLGEYVNIQDNSTLHVDTRSSISVGDYSLIAHNVMLHGCHIGRACMIGIGSIILDGAEVGDGAMITAGCLIRGGKKIPPGAMVINKGGELKIVPGAAKTIMTVMGSLEYVLLAERFVRQQFGPLTADDVRALEGEAREVLRRFGLK
ncbi:MAG: gamma carbonic anhydrase family protein [Leptospiraceae bacterium]|nr:gamma carbonic anhydrase family protein [Leptospiraceae bacterium]